MNQRPRDIGSAPLAAGELAVRTVDDLAQFGGLHGLVYGIPDFGFIRGVQSGPEGKIFPHGKQIVSMLS